MGIKEARHAAAEEILASGRPFVLLLRTYRATPTWDRNIQNEILDRLYPDVGVVSIRGDHALADEEEDQPDATLRARSPALTLSNSSESTWVETARDLIGRAAHIMCEAWTDTAGVSLELSLCRSAGRCDDTVVLIMSHTDGGIRRPETCEDFWRIVIVRDLEHRKIWEHPSVRGLRLLDPEPPPVLPEYDETLLRRRDGIPFVIPELVHLAKGHALRADLQSASIYAQCAVNIGVRLAALDAPVSDAETDALISASYILSRHHTQLFEFDTALRKLEIGFSLAREIPSLQHYVAGLERAKLELSIAKQRVIDGDFSIPM